jgi:hypothetical protein
MIIVKQTKFNNMFSRNYRKEIKAIIFTLSIFLVIFSFAVSVKTAFACGSIDENKTQELNGIYHNCPNTPPTITLIGANPFNIIVGDTFTDPGATATDTQDGNLTSKIIITGSVDSSIVGTYVLTYSVTDSGGLSASIIRTISVSPKVCTSNCGGETDSFDIKIIASKIICNSESDLPNWGSGGPDVTSLTANQFLNTHPNCHLVPNWNFQWAGSTATDPGGSFVGEAVGWNTFGLTNQQGIASTTVSVSSTTPYIWVREVLKNDYLPFTYPGDNNSNSAEMYCYSDVLNYDNFDKIISPFVSGGIYYCVAFNVLNSVPPANTPPVITLVGSSTVNLIVGQTFTDPGATAADTQDGNLTSQIVVTGTVSTSTTGTYTLVYSVTDSGGLSASTTRTIIISPFVCTDNCGPVNTPPTITLIGANPLNITVGDIFADPGATATDLEDGDAMTTSHVVVTGTVSASTVGTYILTYSVTDSGELSASTTRTVIVNATTTPPVNPPVNPPSDNNEGGGGGGGIGGHRHPVTAVQGEILGATSCSYLRDYLKIDRNNDPVEVLKLQSFLNLYENESLPLTGVFNQDTFIAVQRFQTKYSGDILEPWGDKVTTGFVYILTKKKINEIYCNTILSLNQSDRSEINAFKSSGISVSGGVGQSDINPDKGQNISVLNGDINKESVSVPVVGLVSSSLNNSSSSSDSSVVRNAAISLFALPQKIFSSWKYFLIFLILVVIVVAIIRLFRNSPDEDNNVYESPVPDEPEEETFVTDEQKEIKESPTIILPGFKEEKKEVPKILPDEELVIENPEEEPEEIILNDKDEIK